MIAHSSSSSSTSFTQTSTANATSNGGIWSIPLELTNFNIITSVLGGFVSLFGLVSYLLKEHYFLSEARKHSSLNNFHTAYLIN